MVSSNSDEAIEGIAIIGMAGRFPGAKNIEEYWYNLHNGIESISSFTHEELLAAGIEPAWLSDRNYVKAGGVLEDIDLFDASFFDMNPKEAEVTDPQHRLFLESAWKALESAGYDSTKCESRIGVYAGASLNNYLSFNINNDQVGSAKSYQKLIGNDKDFLTTRVSYKLNLTGPSITIQTACSTSLVAITLACQSLLNYQCDMAVAGGVSIRVPHKTGYLYEEGGTLSPDGHCRAFDAKAQGIVVGNGVGVVILKRLSEAIADGDCIHAVIKGAAINNDGSGKVGYTAPSVDGQAEAIAEAIMLADTEPETISYIEAHGTGTALGDPIEVAALSKVFRASTKKTNFCAIGSVKTNIGHLDAAAGVAGLIKTVLALKHKQIPPSLNFEQPNPQIDFANTPFYVNTKLTEWQRGFTPRRAGVSSLGMGGTNAHVILEEAPALSASSPSRPWQLLVISAKTESALETATQNLAEHLTQHPELNLADVAYTLHLGRREFNHRRVLVCQDIQDAVNALQQQDSQRIFTSFEENSNRPIAFMFPGQGAQCVDMGKELYQTEPVFRDQVDRCCLLLIPHLGLDLRSVIYPNGSQTAAAEKLKQTRLAQPALFVIEYALAQLWITWGISPESMIGHSIGEYVAACLAGVMSVEDALALVATRGQLMQQLPSGTMLSVPLSEAEVKPVLNESLSLAAINAPNLCVVSGTHEAVDAIEQQLTAQGVECRRLHTSHAFHSQMMEPILESFIQEVKKVKLNPPQIPFISNVTGTWITAANATDPNYWARHLRQTVDFAAGISTLRQEPNRILLEVGPGRTLCTLAKQQAQVAIASLPHSKDVQPNVAFLLNTLGKLWLSGVQVNWSGFYAYEQRHRLVLPTYPFVRQRYWIEPQKPISLGKLVPTALQLWESLIEAAQKETCAGIAEFHSETYLTNKQWLERLCAAYMNLALRSLGAFSDRSQKYSFEELFEQCQITTRYRQLFSRWLEVLIEQDQLHQDNGLYTNLLPLSKDSVNALVEEVRVRWADTPQQIDLIQICGENLAAVITGKKEPLELHVATLAKEGEISRQNLPCDRYYNGIMQASLKQLVRSLPSNVNLRILEIGGGTGIATAELLFQLPLQQTNYTFTDLGSFFLNKAQKKFSAYPFVEYRLLDIEQPPTEQGYSTHSFDVIIAVNVLHITQNMGKTLEHIRSLLAPQGILLIREITQPQLDFDITDGLLMNPLEDGERCGGNPFLSKEQWQEALHSQGFVEVASFSETEAFGQHILVAQADSSAAPSALAAFTALVEQEDANKTRKDLLHKKPEVADWFYIPSWKRSILPKTFKLEIQAVEQECCLVFIDECGLGSQIVKRLKFEGQNVITVRVGEQFSSKFSQHTYTINPQQPEDYDTLIKELYARNLTPKTIVHSWSVTSNDETKSGIKFFEDCQNLGFYSLLFLAQSFKKQDIIEPINILVVTNNLHEVTGFENLSPEKATVLGISKVILRECPYITCRSIDVVIPTSGTSQEKKLIDQLIAELTAKPSDLVVAYRGHHRWVQTFEAVGLENSKDQPSIAAKSRLREEGVYLITGGLGGIGLELAEYLAQTARAKLILIGRSAIPQKDEWEQWLATHDDQDEVSQKIQKLRAIANLGAEILTVNADVANEAQMQAAIAQASEHFGQIHGVIHAAGIKFFSTIQEINRSDCEQQLRTNGHGLFVLEKVLQNRELDFCLLISSLSSVLGAVGMAAYPAAHLFTDAFVYKHNQTHPVLWTSVNWDNWLTSKLANDPTVKISTELFMNLKEGVEVFERVLSLDTGTQIVISTVDLQTNLEQWLNRESLKDTEHSQKVNSPSLHLRPNLQNSYVAPSNQIEQSIANIWQEILGIEQVGIHDNFFELGGDSLLSIQIIARANKVGLRITNKQLFEYPTIAELAAVAGTTQTVFAEQGLVQGIVPLTPIQHWFFEQDLLDPHHWNKAILLVETSEAKSLDAGLLEQVVQHLLVQHDALRLCFAREQSGWKQVNASPDEVVPFSKLDLSGLPPESQEEAFEAAAAQLQETLNLSAGPLMKVALFDMGTHKPNRLLLIFHHLGVDLLSLRILLEDLETIYQQLSQGKVIQLSPKTTSFKRWAEQLIEYAQSANLQQELDYWQATPREQLSPLPIDYPEGANTVASAQTVSVTLNVEQTRALLQEVPAAYRVHIDEVLLTALVQAAAGWTGRQSLLVDLEGSGRDVFFDEVDLSRTVGWFTNIAPVLLEIGEASQPREALKEVKEQLRSVPNHGLGYGVLRYLSENKAITEKLRSLQPAEIIFLYLGQLDQTLHESSLFRQSEEFTKSTCSPDGKRSHLLEVRGVVTQGQLRVDWNYSENVHRRNTIEQLAEDFITALQILINCCQSASVEDYTPSDFAEFKFSQWSQTDLENIMAAVNKTQGLQAQ